MPLTFLTPQSSSFPSVSLPLPSWSPQWSFFPSAFLYKSWSYLVLHFPAHFLLLKGIAHLHCFKRHLQAKSFQIPLSNLPYSARPSFRLFSVFPDAHRHFPSTRKILIIIAPTLSHFPVMVSHRNPTSVSGSSHFLSITPS